MGKKSREYVSIKKILKRHYKLSKDIKIKDVGRKRNCYIVVCSPNDDCFYDAYSVNVQQDFEGEIILFACRQGNEDGVLFSKKIDNLDKLFELLSHKGIMLKRILDDKVLVKDI